MNIAGVIIAGGRSSRMGGEDKAFKTIGGRTILDRVIARIGPQVDALAINANGDAGRFSSTGLAVFPDRLTAIATPLAGIHAGLTWARDNGHDLLLTVPADTPFLPRDLVARLAAPAIAASGGQEHFIVGVWSTSLADMLERAIRDDGLVRVMDWAARVHAKAVAWPATPFDPFFNVNTPADLAEAARIAAEFDP
ncbi:MAG: molybdenum cofactor guanylyltransferase MobA [Hyphomicrobiales bacterium]